MGATLAQRFRPLVPVILAGGRGERLWPVSRESRPKPFLRIAGERSLLQQTVLRAAALMPDAIVIATHEECCFQVFEELEEIAPQLDGAFLHILLEPETRDTAPAVCAAALYVARSFGKQAELLVLPSDQLIDEQAKFAACIARAREAAAAERIAVLGTPASTPQTGFGYIARESDGRDAGSFVEKPDRRLAEHFVASGRYDWHTGICLATAEVLEAAFAQHAPDILAATRSALVRGRRLAGHAQVFRMDREAWAALPEISLDYALLEKATGLAAVRADFAWQDIGTWTSLSALAAADSAGNQVEGKAVFVNARNNYVQSDGRLVAAVGVQNLVIVDTPDALLVGSQDAAAEVGRIAEQLRRRREEAGFQHRTVHRPWGTFTVLCEDEHCKIKRLRVKPGAALSLQLHRHRGEHWVVVEGEAEVINGDATFRLKRHQSTYIPPGCRHRIANPGTRDVVIIETQTGDYLGEDDIVRLEDRYGRTQH
ncbi:MAG TPA: mannose-1-phosphate guanylyltransferase/mannose-6-phosphate isomerase [Gammaproteobacteria bacterium]|nr:mannose-1-phosphate guanylyltransferase/mannose-6-phosphate isomerase [Gammaproteobacteria bacterium]